MSVGNSHLYFAKFSLNDKRDNRKCGYLLWLRVNRVDEGKINARPNSFTPRYSVNIATYKFCNRTKLKANFKIIYSPVSGVLELGVLVADK